MKPVLESWDAAGHPSRLRLRAYLDSVVELVGPVADGQDGSLALSLDVGLDDHVALTSGGHDLDNYLFPVIRTLGADRFDAAFARKAHAGSSTIALGPATPAAPDTDDWGGPQLSVRTSVSASSTAWKQGIHRACQAARPEVLPGTPIGLRLCFQVSAARNWSTLWKPAIDALGPLLGVPDPARPYRPNDDRIVELSLHRNIVAALGHDIVITAWWRSLSPATASGS
ncbi:hypothetical protein ACFWVC_36200 [Streptomyces sp. NPDC058691]|uniref:hypothetical protein n=1 Tax=Streptomyces sp. NPDC058691 TaxID=3346601 RepID=UPI0036601041